MPSERVQSRGPTCAIGPMHAEQRPGGAGRQRVVYRIGLPGTGLPGISGTMAVCPTAYTVSWLGRSCPTTSPVTYCTHVRVYAHPWRRRAPACACAPCARTAAHRSPRARAVGFVRCQLFANMIHVRYRPPPPRGCTLCATPAGPASPYLAGYYNAGYYIAYQIVASRGGLRRPAHPGCHAVGCGSWRAAAGHRRAAATP